MVQVVDGIGYGKTDGKKGGQGWKNNTDKRIDRKPRRKKEKASSFF